MTAQCFIAVKCFETVLNVMVLPRRAFLEAEDSFIGCVTLAGLLLVPTLVVKPYADQESAPLPTPQKCELIKIKTQRFIHGNKLLKSARVFLEVNHSSKRTKFTNASPPRQGQVLLFFHL